MKMTLPQGCEINVGKNELTITFPDNLGTVDNPIIPQSIGQLFLDKLAWQFLNCWFWAPDLITNNPNAKRDFDCRGEYTEEEISGFIRNAYWNGIFGVPEESFPLAAIPVYEVLKTIRERYAQDLSFGRHSLLDGGDVRTWRFKHQPAGV